METGGKGVPVKKHWYKKGNKNIVKEQLQTRVTREAGPDGEEKILNASDKEIFMCTSDVFEETLSRLTVDNDEEIYEKLVRVQDVIQEKLMTFFTARQGRSENGNDALFYTNLTSSKSLASSMQSLSSQKSVSTEVLKRSKAYKEFLIKVNCPFCSEAQDDKIKLIKHLDGNCEPLRNNIFEETNFITFSAFQVLPNNMIKCNICYNTVLRNLECFYVHLHSKLHKSGYANAQKLKKYTEFLFCSCCKVLIPNNYTQLDFHMNHEVHKNRAGNAPNLASFGNVDCVYLKNKKFRCLSCSSKPSYQSAKDILEHFERDKHRNRLKNSMFPTAFCEVCMEELQIFEVLSHLKSYSHINNEKSQAGQEWYEMCCYCGFVCKNLKELAAHMKTQCAEIINMREQNLKLEKLLTNDVIKAESGKKIKSESEKKKKGKNLMPKTACQEKETIIKEENDKGGLHIIVKDTTNVLEVYRYFKKFGEITRVEIYKENNVLIQFRDESAVKDVLLLQDVIHINGVKMEITTDEKLTKPSDKDQLEKGTNVVKNRRQCLAVSDDSKTDDSDSPDEIEPVVQNQKLEDLFLRVSQHLSNTAKTFDSSLEEKIIRDCCKIFGGNRKCSVIGFAGCELSFPVENIHLYWDVTEGLSETEAEYVSGARHIQINLVKRFYIKFCDTTEWQAVKYHLDSSLPHIECTHAATQKCFTFTFTPSAKLLTDMLRYYKEEVNGAGKFCLIVRFWLSVQNLEIRKLDFVVIALLLFFLMSNYVAGNFFAEYDFPSETAAFHSMLSEEIGRGPLPSAKKVAGPSSVVQMFQEFLKFLREFNFKKNFIILPVLHPVPRKIIHIMRFFKSIDIDEVRDSPMCIIDPHLCVNLAREATQDDLDALLKAAALPAYG